MGAEEVERADNSRGELFTPTEDDRVGRLFGLTGVGTESKSWSAAHKPPTAAVQTNTAGVSGGCRMRKAFITTPTPTKTLENDAPLRLSLHTGKVIWSQSKVLCPIVFP